MAWETGPLSLRAYPPTLLQRLGGLCLGGIYYSLLLFTVKVWFNPTWIYRQLTIWFIYFACDTKLGLVSSHRSPPLIYTYTVKFILHMSAIDDLVYILCLWHQFRVWARRRVSDLIYSIYAWFILPILAIDDKTKEFTSFLLTPTPERICFIRRQEHKSDNYTMIYCSFLSENDVAQTQ